MLNVSKDNISYINFDKKLIKQKITSMGFCSDSYQFTGSEKSKTELKNNTNN